jgi:hypothetical protein
MLIFFNFFGTRVGRGNDWVSVQRVKDPVAKAIH